METSHKVPKQFSSSEYIGRNPISSTPSTPSTVISLDWFTQDMWEQIFPYCKASAVFCHDGKSFWTRRDFFESINWMNKNKNSVFHNFGTDSSNLRINKLEMAAFLGNFQQETGEPSITAPYPWAWPKINPVGAIWEGNAGGALGIMEGVIPEIYFGDSPPFAAQLIGISLPLSETERKVLGVTDTKMGGIIRTLGQINQPQFGLPNAGVVFQDNLVGVSQDGTLYGNNPDNEIVGKVFPSSNIIRTDTTNPKYNALSPVSQYGGRGAIQLSYNYNYTDCSLALFGDYRLVRYPNLITTTDRENFNGIPKTFGFPGPNVDGNNKLPQWIKDTTPPARQLAFITCFWFWMDRNRSGRKISCHQCMLEPTKYGICGTNLIVNNQDGLTKSWAYNKVEYYRRICNIMGLTDIDSTIVKPPRELYN